MSFEYNNNQLYSTYFVGFNNKTIYYLHYFLLFSKLTYYFVLQNLPTNSDYFRKNYTLFLVALLINYKMKIRNFTGKLRSHRPDSPYGCQGRSQHGARGAVAPSPRRSYCPPPQLEKSFCCTVYCP